LNIKSPVPIIIDSNGARPVTPLSLSSGPDQISEADLQRLIHAFPNCLPIREIDPLFADPISLCMELSTNAGPIDNLLITDSGLPIIVECKLWRNPEGRREVVGQILDYAKELTRWSAADLQREVARRTGISERPVLALLKAASRRVDEAQFNDALTHNLRRGRFLLLIVGDGIREGVETIAEYLQSHANLHFSLGLVEMPVFVSDEGTKIVVPRVLARTHLIERQVIAVPDGFIVQEESESGEDDDADVGSRINFWKAFVSDLELDDPEQGPPKPNRTGAIYMALPAPRGALWMTIYRVESGPRVGLYLSYTRESIGARVVERLLEDWEALRDELGEPIVIETDKLGRKLIMSFSQIGSWTVPAEREEAFIWLRARTNQFVNVLRPKIRAIVADIEREG
jgi:hypothetical protein